MLKNLVFGAVAVVVGFVGSVASAADLSQMTRLPIGSVDLSSSDKLPDSVAESEHRDRVLAFDRDTETGLTLYDAASLDVVLDAEYEISEIRVFGAAPYRLELFESASAKKALQKIDLTKLGSGWNVIPVADGLFAESLRLELTPKGGTDATALAELELWGTAQRIDMDAAAIADQLDLDGAFAQWRSFDFAFDGETVLLNGDNQVASSTVDIPYLSTEIRAAYLEYDLKGDGALIALARNFNGSDVQGGYPFAPDDQWVTQIEEIDPTQLKSGQNRFGLSLGDTDGALELRNARLIVELASGATIGWAEGLSAALDDDPNTVLSVDGGGSTIEFELEKTASADAAIVTLGSAASGAFAIDAYRDDQWVLISDANADLAGAIAGDAVLVPLDGEPAQKLRLRFEGVELPFSIATLQVTGSELGSTWGSTDLNVTWPLEGENYGRVGIIRGFVSQPDVDDVRAELFVAGLPMELSGGAFEAVVSREQAGFGETNDAEPWNVELLLVRPDGSEVTEVVEFAGKSDSGTAVDNYLPEPVVETVSEETGGEITNDGASLVIGENAVQGDTEISVTPLLDAELARLDAGLTNVTRGKNKGYRMLPHMKFKKKIKLKLEYDDSLIPEGFNEDDIKIYFFDTDRGRWVALDGATINKTGKWVRAETDHFTDFIAGVVVAPDAPQTASFNPTQIKGIKAADPTAKINLIEAPSGNSNGDANLSYPIELPAGRLGMAPSLQVGYSSAGQNGWMGIGWNLNVPEISIDTRWGVPRYDDAYETETYSFNGQMLTPVAHRAALVPRESDRVFHTRIEGGFQKITRHGNNPANYWWEVVDKMGTRYAYGGDLTTGAIKASAVLLTGAGDAYRWKLTEVRDTNGNFTKYHYGKVASTGLKQGSNVGKNIYPERITYTGHGAAEGPYEVRFTRDRELPGFTERKDTTIDGRGGFKMVTADLLRHIEVRLNGEPIRAYEFAYEEGAYHKTLLQSITQYGADGTAFNTHSFDYHDDARKADGSYKGFAPNVSWNMPGGDVSGVSALQGSEADSSGGFFNIGLSLLAPTWEYAPLTVGAKFGADDGDVEHLIALIDIDGDGLADKVYRDGGNVFYRKNQSGSAGGGSISFSSSVATVANLNRIGYERSNSGNRTIEVALFGFNAGLTRSDGTTESEVYFSDVNGDGLVDLVNGPTVLFNRINNQGKPVFTPDVTATAYPIPDSAASADVLDVDLSHVLAEIEKSSPLVDAVTVWEAPYDGQINIASSVVLNQFTGQNRDDYGTADGVRVAIQLESAELWALSIAADDYSAKPANLGPLTVSKGDRLFFRVQSNYDGAFDRVAWDPRIEYQGVSLALADSNDLPVHVYDHADDFTLFGFGNGAMAAPKDGAVQVSGTLVKSASTTDDVTLELIVNGTVVDSHVFAAGSTGSYSISESLNVVSTVSDPDSSTVTQQADTIAIRLSNDSRIDAGALSWSASNPPRFTYTSFTDGSAATDASGDPTVEVPLYSTINLLSGSNFNIPASAWVVPETGTYEMTPEATIIAGAPDGSLFLTIKENGGRLYKEELSVVNGALDASPFAIELTAGQEIWIEYADPTSAMAEYVSEARLHIELPDPADTTPPIANLVDELWVAELHSGDYSAMAGEAHRGWLHIGYNGNQPDQPVMISESDLGMPSQAEMEALAEEIQQAAQDQSTDDAIFDSMDQKVFTLTPEYDVARWEGAETEIFISATKMASSRLNTNYPSVPDPTVFAGARGVPQISVTENRNFTIGALFASLSKTDTVSYSILDYMDVNGDSFPDILSPNGRIQYTHMLGALENQVRTAANLEGFTRRSHGSSESISIGGGKSISMGDANGHLSATGGGGAHGQLGLSLGRATVGLSFTPSAETYSDYDLQDVNGDGLPDLLKQDGDALVAHLSIGYSYLAAAETYGLTQLNEAENKNTTLSLGFNTGLSSLSISGSSSDAYSRVNVSLTDMNGDGMLDAVRRGSGNNLVVALNSGSGFEAPIDWSTGGQGAEFVETNSETLSFGGSATVYIPILPIAPIFYLDIGGGLSFGDTTSWSLVRVSDVNGDGDPDLLRSTNDGELRVSYGTEGRTNMLKRVHRPLGAKIAMDYAVSGNTYDQPSNRWVMKRVEVNDGHAGDGNDLLVTNFAYAGGKYHRQEREFYGFAKVTEDHMDYVSATNETIYRTIINRFSNDSYYSKGLLLTSLTKDAGDNKYLKTTNTYAFRDIDTGTDADLTSLTATVFPQLVRTDKEFFEGQAVAGKATYTTFEYDDLGNVVRFFDAANLDTAADDVESLIGYHSEPATYIVGKANSVVVNGAGAEMRRRTATFQPGTGNLLEVSSYLEDGSMSQTSLAYDARGNLLQVQGAENLNGQRYTLDYVFDTEVQTYVTSTTDSFGYASSAEYDYRFGEVLLTKDLNGQEITNTLDEFGRVTTITGPYQSTDATITFAYNPRLKVPNAPVTYPNVPLSWALTQHIDTYRDLGDPIETVLFADGLGRVLQTKKDATIHNGGTYADKMVASGRVTFDHVGRQVEQYYPVEEALGNQGTFNATFDNVDPTVTTYDVLDRPLTITIPDGSSTQMAYGFGNDRSGTTQFRTKFTDAEGKERETFADVRGLMTSVLEKNPAGGQPNIWTSYEYDPLKQITLVTDDQNNQTTSSYDNLGRQIAIDSPDMGLTEFTYDLASNLTAKETANLRAAGQEITYQYDFNRLMGVTYPQFTDNNITYTYGAPGDDFNRANRIVTVDSQAGREERFYGPLGETVKTILTVTSDTQGNSAGAPEIYTTEYTYDTWNRLQSMLYPDGETIVNSYDSGGKIITIDGTKAGWDYSYLKEMGYDKFGQRTYMRLGNNTETNYTYTADTRRLDKLDTFSQQTGRTFQSLSYGYDLVGNVLSLTNSAENADTSLLGGGTDYTYGYDDLYRLTSATGEWRHPNNPEAFDLAMTYDTIHNIVTKTRNHSISGKHRKQTSIDWTYEYGAQQPHAQSHIGERSYTYDANGNQTGWEHDKNSNRREILWDEENRMRMSTDNGKDTVYKYNDAGERVFKIGAQGETVYVNQFYIIRGGSTARKHYFAGASRVASKVADKPAEPGEIFDNNEHIQYFYHPDHLGSSSYVTDALGQVFQHVQYYPFGETWVEEHSSRQRTPFLFTGKELDEDTGLYYFGARYYDPRTSVWQSPDPILASYLRGAPANGVYEPANLALYGYVRNRPLVMNDPTGEFGIFGAVIGAVGGVVVQGAIDLYNREMSSLGSYAGAAVGGAITGATAGLGSGIAAGAIAVGTGAAGGAASEITQSMVDGEAVTVSNVVNAAAIGGAGGALGAGMGKAVEKGLDAVPNSVKGKIGEKVTELKYAAKGYRSAGKAKVPTGGKTPTGRTQRAHYDHRMEDATGLSRPDLTVESKFNTSGLTSNQVKAQANVATEGGLIVDRTTSSQLGAIPNAAIAGGSMAPANSDMYLYPTHNMVE